MTSSPEPRHAAQRETGDLALAAYAHMKGFRIVKAEEIRKGHITEYRFMVHDPEERWDELCVDFANSEASQHDASVRTLKRLCKRTSNGGRS